MYSNPIYRIIKDLEENNFKRTNSNAENNRNIILFNQDLDNGYATPYSKSNSCNIMDRNNNNLKEQFNMNNINQNNLNENCYNNKNIMNNNGKMNININTNNINMNNMNINNIVMNKNFINNSKFNDGNMNIDIFNSNINNDNNNKINYNNLNLKNSNKMTNNNNFNNNINNNINNEKKMIVIFEDKGGVPYIINCRAKDKIGLIINEYRNISLDKKSLLFNFKDKQIVDMDKTLEELKISNNSYIKVCD